MSWEALAALSEAVSAIALTATLIFIILQIRHMRQQTALASFQHIYDDINRFDASLAESAPLASLIVRGSASMAALSPIERFQFENVFGRLFNIIESWHFQISETAPPGAYRDEQLRNIANFVSTRCNRPGVLEFWSHYQHCYNEAVHRLVRENTHPTDLESAGNA